MPDWMGRVRLAVNTGRHLRPRQAIALAQHKLAGTPRPHRPDPDLRWDPTAASAIAALGPVDTKEAVTQRMASLAQGRVELLGLSALWDPTWRFGSITVPLWHYHIHYHDLLAEAAWHVRAGLDSDLTRRLVEGLDTWINHCGTGGRPAWDAYPSALRLVNWLRILSWCGNLLPAALKSRMIALHASHVGLLGDRLELHLQGNHLLRNASALVVGSRCWEGPKALKNCMRWQEFYFGQLLSQTDEDGMHEERSPMYHVRALRDALEVLAVLDVVGQVVPTIVRERIRMMADLVPWLRRTDGSLFLLNDSMHDHGVDLDRIVDLARGLADAPGHPPEGLRFLRSAGIVVLVHGPTGDRVTVDLGAPAPAHQPGHAHAGALGIEIDLGGRPVLVDPGCGGYEEDPFRPYLRGTRAHNTVTVDDEDQSEMWGTFRVARRAAVTADEVRGNGNEFVARGSCRPYHDPSVCHLRTVRRRGRTIVVEDKVTGGAGKRVALHWHLHPGWTVDGGGSVLRLRHVSGLQAMMRLEGLDTTSLHRGEREPNLGWYAGVLHRPVPTWTVRGSVNHNDHRLIRTTIEPAP